MLTAFKFFETHTEIPKDVIDTIAKKLYAEKFVHVIADIKKAYTPFERMFYENAKPTVAQLAKIALEPLRIYKDYHSDWDTIVFKLSQKHFVLYHKHDHNTFLIEGSIKSGKFIFDRFEYHDRNLNLKVYTSKYFKDVLFFSLPFLYQVMDIPEEEGMDCFEGGGRWHNADKIKQWIHENWIHEDFHIDFDTFEILNLE